MNTEEALSAVGTPEIKMRVYYSAYHLWAAKHFAELAKQIESVHVGRSVFNIEHRAYATGVILSAVAFMEAAINEIFQDVVDKHTSYIEPLSVEARSLMSTFWELTEAFSILDKYQIALVFARKEPFPKGNLPYQDADLLIRLRNTLVHYKPKTLGGSDEPKLEKMLKGKFPTNKLMEGAGNPFFPDQCLGYGCCEWAVASSRTFVDDFFAKIGVTPNYQRVIFGEASS